MKGAQPAADVVSTLSVRHSALKWVRSPLGFFVLSLLIVEGLIFGAGTLFGLPMVWKLITLGVGVFLFLMVFWTVVWLVVKHPRKLVFSETSYVEFAALVFGDKSHPITGRELDELPTAKDISTSAVGELPDSGQAK